MKTLDITGMHCKGCALAVTAALEKLPFVKRATVDHVKGSAALEVDEALYDERAARDAVRAAGFTAK